jgi:hypothetical protein
MQANTICIQSIHVRSRLILISVTCDVTVQNSVLILRDLFAKNQPTKMQNNTKCIQPINIRSRLILISVTVQNSVLVLRGFIPDVSHFEISILLVFSVCHGMSLSDP